MRPTSLGIKALVFYGMLVGAFYVSPYTNLFFLLISFLGVVLALNGFWTAANLRRIVGEIKDLEPCAAGAPALVRVHARVEGGRRIRFKIEAAVQVEGHIEAVGTAPLLQDECVIKGHVAARPRGVYRLERAFLHTTYPLGLVRIRSAIPAPEHLVVYPAVLSGPARRGDGGIVEDLLGEAALHGADDAGPSGLREYQSGDPVRLVHWRATARRGELVVKELDGEGRPGVEIWLDRRTDDERLELALRVVSTLALRARDDKEPLQLYSQGIQRTYGEGHEPIRELLSWLAAAEAVPQGGPAPPPAPRQALRLPQHIGATEASG